MPLKIFTSLSITLLLFTWVSLSPNVSSQSTDSFSCNVGNFTTSSVLYALNSSFGASTVNSLSCQQNCRNQKLAILWSSVCFCYNNSVIDTIYGSVLNCSYICSPGQNGTCVDPRNALKVYQATTNTTTSTTITSAVSQALIGTPITVTTGNQDSINLTGTISTFDTGPVKTFVPGPQTYTCYQPGANLISYNTIDGMNTSLLSCLSTTMTVYTELTTLNYSRDLIFYFQSGGYLEFYLPMVSSPFVTVNFGDGSTVTSFNNTQETSSFTFGYDPSQATDNSSSVVDKLYLSTYHISDRNGTWYGVFANFKTAGTMTFAVYNPSCSNSTFQRCLSTNQCMPLSANCSGHFIRSCLSTATRNRYALQRRTCTNANGYTSTFFDDNRDSRGLNFDYFLNGTVNVSIPNPGIQYVYFPTQLTLQRGSVAAFVSFSVAGGATILAGSGTLINEMFTVTASNFLSSFSTVTSAQASVALTDTTQEFLFRVLAYAGVTFSIPNNYTTHFCTTDPPQMPACSVPITYNATVTVTNQYTGTKRVLVDKVDVRVNISQFVINFSNPVEASVNSLFIIPKHLSIMPVYHWRWGDGHEYVIPQQRNMTYYYPFIGSYVLFVRCYNDYSFAVNSVNVTVQCKLKDLALSNSLLLYAQEDQNLIVTFYTSMACGVNYTLTWYELFDNLSISSVASTVDNVTASENLQMYGLNDYFNLLINAMPWTGIPFISETTPADLNSCLLTCIANGCTFIDWAPSETPKCRRYVNVSLLNSTFNTVVPANGHLLYQHIGATDQLCYSSYLISRSNWHWNASSSATGVVDTMNVTLQQSSTGWEPLASDLRPFFEISFDTFVYINEISITGSPSGKFLSNFNIYTSNDTVNLTLIPLNFTGPSSASVVQVISSKNIAAFVPFGTRMIRITPIPANNSNIGLRLNILACAGLQYQTTVTKSFSKAGSYMLSYTASTPMGSLTRQSVIRVESPIVNVVFVVPLGIRMYSVGVIPYSWTNGSAIKMNGTVFGSYPLQSYNFMNSSSRSGSLILPSNLVASYGMYPIVITIDNFATASQTQTLNVWYDFSLDNTSVYHRNIHCNRTEVCGAFLYVPLATRFNLTVNYGDTANTGDIVSRYYFYWSNSTNGSIDISHTYNTVGVYTMIISIVNPVSSFNYTQVIRVYNPLRPTLNYQSIKVTPTIPILPSAQATAFMVFTQTGPATDVPTNCTVLASYSETASEYLSIFDWTDTSTNVSKTHLYNQEGFYWIQLFIFNNVSSITQNYSVQVDQVILGATLIASTYSALTNASVIFTLTSTWGTRMNITVDMNDGQPLMSWYRVYAPNITINYSYPLPKNNYLPTARLQNTVSNVSIATPQPLLIEHMVNLYTIVGSNVSLLFRSNNTQFPRSLYTICLNTFTATILPPSNPLYTVDWNDGSPLEYSNTTCHFDSTRDSLCPTGYKFCRNTLPHAYTVVAAYAVNFNFSNSNSRFSATFRHIVYSEIVKLNQSANVNPIFPQNGPEWQSIPEQIYPLDNGIFFNATMIYGQEFPLTYEWDFGDKNGIRVTNTSFILYTYRRPGTYNVTCRVNNPVDLKFISMIITAYKRVNRLQVSSTQPFPMNTPYQIDLTVFEMGTGACYYFDMRGAQSVLMNTSRLNVFFGNKSMCYTRYPSSLVDPYYDQNATDQLTAGYATYMSSTALSSSRFDYPVTVVFSYFGMYRVFFYGWNKVSFTNVSYNLPITKGPCFFPKTNLKAGMSGTTFKRKNSIQIGSQAAISCYNTSTQITWSLFQLVSGSPVDYTPVLSKFYEKFPTRSGNQSLSYYMQGIYYPTINLNKHLVTLNLPPFALEAAASYRVSIYLEILNEPDINMTESVDFDVSLGSLMPCVQIIPSKGDFVTSSIPGLVVWGNLTTLSSACTTDEDVDYEGGESDTISTDWYCYPACETSPVYSKDYSTATPGDNSKCFSNETGETRQGCFRDNLLQAGRPKLVRYNKTDWALDTTLSATKEVIEKYGWKIINESNKFFYYMLPTSTIKFQSFLFNSKYLYEGQTTMFDLIARDITGVKQTQRYSYPLDVALGQPPILSTLCVTNCRKGLISGSSKRSVIKVDPYAPLKFQTNIVNREPNVRYDYLWCQSKAILGNPDDFKFTTLKIELANSVCNSPALALMTSTGVNGPGLSYDVVYPIFKVPPEPAYYLIRVESWRAGVRNTTGYTLDMFAINTPPDGSEATVDISPLKGFALSTQFTITVNNVIDLDEPLLYSYGFSRAMEKTEANINPNKDCTFSIRDITTNVFTTILPAGSDAYNGSLWVCIRVADFLDSAVFMYQMITVKQKTVPLLSSPADTSSTIKLMQDLAKTGDPKMFISSAMPIASELTQLGKPSSSNLIDEDSSHSDELKKTKNLKSTMQESIANSLSQVASSFPPSDTASGNVTNSLMLMNVLGMCVDDPTIVKQDTVSASLDVMDSLLKVVGPSATSNQVSSDNIEAVASSFLLVLGNLVQTQVSQVSQQKTIAGNGTTTELLNAQSDAKKVVARAAEQKRNLVQIMSNKIVVGQGNVSIQAPNMGITLNKLSATGFDGTTMNSGRPQDCSRFNVKGLSKLFRDPNPLKDNDTVEAVAVESTVTIETKNPYLWGNGSSSVNSRVMSQDFGSVTQKKDFTIRNLDDNSTISVWVDTIIGNSDLEYTYQDTVLSTESMKYHTIDLEADQALFVELHHFLNYTNVTIPRKYPNGTVQGIQQVILANNYTYIYDDVEFYVFVSREEFPTESNYLQMCRLPLFRQPSCTESSENPSSSRTTTTTGSPGTYSTTTTMSYTTTTMYSYVSQCYCDAYSTCSEYASADGMTTPAYSNDSVYNVDLSALEPCRCAYSQSLGNSTCVPTNAASNSTDEVDICAMKKSGVSGTKLRTCFFSGKALNSSVPGKYYIGIRALKTGVFNGTSIWNDTNPNAKSINLDASKYVVATYKGLLYASGCYFYDTTEERLSTAGCKVGACSTPFSTQCICNHLTSFMSSFYVPPVKISLTDSGFTKLDSNPIAFALCISIGCFYLLVIIYARKRDKDALLKVGITPLIDNDPRDQYAYEVTVFTGRRAKAGTTSHVCLIVTGEECETGPRPLLDFKRPVLQRGGTDSFLMTSNEYLGILTHIRIYHDNHGPKPGWYFSRILIQDLQTNRKFYFICNRWLAIDEDDGLIDRVIPVAGIEEVRSFQHVFWSRGNKNLFDGHLWFSVVTRPSRSKFTRVQRATCCLVLLMFTLMTSLMFYQQSANAESPKLIELGPMKFTTTSIFTSTITSLIIIPISTLIIAIFKNRKNRPQPKVNKPKSSESYRTKEAPSVEKAASALGSSAGIPPQDRKKPSLTPEEIFLNRQEEFARERKLVQEEEIRYTILGQCGKCFSAIYPFPWWAFIIGYILSFLCFCVCTYLMVEFGGTLGEAKTSEWLASVAVSVIQSVLIVQPIKIIVIVTVFSLIIRTPEDAEDEMSKALLDQGVPPLHEQLTIDDIFNEEKMEALRLYKRNTFPPPDPQTLEEARQKRQKEREMKVILKECMFYFLFLFVLMTNAYTYVDPLAYRQNSIVRTIFAHNFQSIRTLTDIQQYATSTYIPSLYPNSCYNDDTTCDLIRANYSCDPQLYRVRNGQIRQVRNKMKKDSGCSIVKEFSTIIGRCRVEYSLFKEENGAFFPGWVDLNETGPVTVPQAWNFTSSMDVYGYPISGLLATYGGGGFVASLGNTQSQALSIFGDLSSYNWFDEYTRAIFFEFILYNAGTNLYTVSQMIVEQFIGGGYVMSNQFLTLRLDRYTGVYFVFYLTLDILTGGCILLFVIKEIREMRAKKWDYFKSTWNILDTSVVLSSILFFIFTAFSLAIKSILTYLMNKNPDKYISWQYLLTITQLKQFFMALIVFCYTLRFIRLLSFNRKIAMMGNVLQKASAPLFYFLIMFLIIFFAFVQMGYLLFMKTVSSFQQVSQTIKTLGVMTLNKFDFTTFAAGGGSLGYVFFVIYMLLMSFVLVNFFITTIEQAFQQVKEDWESTQNQYDILDYVVGSLKSLFGIEDRASKGIALDRKFQYLEETVDSEQLFNDVNQRIDQLMMRFRDYLSREGVGAGEGNEAPKATTIRYTSDMIIDADS